MKSDFSPLFKKFGSAKYVNVFIISGIVFSLTAIIAIYYSNLDLIRNQKTDFCISKNNLFCIVNSNNKLKILNLFLKTFTSTSIVNTLFLLLFGWGGGSLYNFYKPRKEDIMHCVLLLFILIIINFIFYYIIIKHYLISNKIQKNPRFYQVIKAILYEYGFENRLHESVGKDEKMEVKMKKIQSLNKVNDKLKYLQTMNLKDKARVLNLLNLDQRTFILKHMNEREQILYLSLISNFEASKTLDNIY